MTRSEPHDELPAIEEALDDPRRPSLHLLVDRSPPPPAIPDVDWSKALWSPELVRRLLRACDDELDDALIAWVARRMAARGALRPKLSWLDGRRRRLDARRATTELLNKIEARRRWEQAADPEAPGDPGPQDAPALDRETTAFAAYLAVRNGREGLGLRASRILLELEQGRPERAMALWREDEESARRPRLAAGLQRWLAGGRPPLLLGERGPTQRPS